MRLQEIAEMFLAVCIAGGMASISHAVPPSFPTKPVRWVVPYSAGGPTDLLARIVGQKVTEIWGQQIVVDLRPGANSIIGTGIVAHAQPDGYTMLLALPAFTINPSVHRKLPYDSVRDFIPVTLIASAAYLVVVNPTLQVRSIQDLVERAKARPGQLTFGSGGIASPAHLAMELLMQSSKIDMVHVPYKGGAPALADLVSGQIQAMINPALSALPLVKSGKLRVIAVTSSKRSSLFPKLPTVAESGLPGYDVGTWYGLFAPKDSPRTIIKLTSETVAQALRDDQVRKRLTEFDASPIGTSPEEFNRFVGAEMKKWRKAVESAKISPSGG